SGKLVLYTSESRFKIIYHKYGPIRKELMLELREFLPESIQTGWPEFEFLYFPDDAERERRRRKANQPVSLAIVLVIMTPVTWMLAFTVWALIGEYFERPQLAWPGAGLVVLAAVLWIVIDWRRAKAKSKLG